MSLPRIRLLTVAGATFALAASLLVTTPAVSSESTDDSTGALEVSAVDLIPGTTADTQPVPPAESMPADLAVSSPQIFGEMLIRLQVNIGKDNPVVRSRVVVRSTGGEQLLRGYTNGVGQAIFLTQQKLPDRVVVRVTGGRSKALKGSVIDLRAFFEPRDGEVVDVNPLTTMDELCRSGAYGTFCSTAVDSFYRLKGSVDYRDLVAISDRWFNGTRFGRDAAKRGLTTWQWAQRVLLKAYAGKKAPKLTSAQAEMSTRAGGLAASWTFAAVGSSLLKGASGGVAGSLASRYFNKLMVAAGVFEGDPDVVGEIDALRAEMRQHFAELERGVNGLKEGQAQLQNRLRDLYGANQATQYRAAVNAFDERDRRTRMDDLLDSWRFLAAFAGCLADGRPGCTSIAQADSQSSQDLDICGRQALGEVTGSLARQAVVLCAEFRRILGNYAGSFTVNGVRDRVLGMDQSNTRGLIPLSQEVYARTVLDGIVTSRSQGDMIRVGSYWLGEWAKDKAMWAVITTDSQLVNRLNSGADTAVRQALELQTRYDQVAQDATGSYFPTRIPVGCSFVFYDMDTKRLFARGFSHYYNYVGGRPGSYPLVVNRPRIPAEDYAGDINACPWLQPASFTADKGPELRDPWTVAPTQLVPSLSNAIRHMRRVWPAILDRDPWTGRERGERNPARLSVGTMNSRDGCYNLKLGDHLFNSTGHVIMCPFIDYGGSEAATVKIDGGRPAMACVSADFDAAILTYTGVDQWTHIYWNRYQEVFNRNPSSLDVVTGCRGSSDSNTSFFPGDYEGTWDKCSRRFVGVCTRTDRGPFKGANGGDHDRTKTIGGGYIRDYLPYYSDKVPSGVSPRKMSSWVRHSLLTMPYPGAVPGS